MAQAQFKQFTMPTRIIDGIGSMSAIPDEARVLKITKALIVTDEGIVKSGLVDELKKVLEAGKLPYAVFSDVQVNPTEKNVEDGVKAAKDGNCDGLIVLGGGSPLCAGRAIGLVVTNGGIIADYEGRDKYKVPPLPLIAVPTTAGSGAEVSANVVIENEKDKRNMTITGYDCYPDVAILDPAVLVTLPKNPALYAGFDALVHAFEAIHSLKASLITDTLAYGAIVTLMNSITRGSLTPDINDKHTQLVGSTMANMACGNASLGLVHAMGTAMSEYNLPHGYKNGILLPYIMEFNLPVCRKKYEHILYELGCESCCAELLIEKIKSLYIDTDFEDRLPADKVPVDAIPKLTAIVSKHPFPKFNIRKVTEADITTIYKKAFAGWKE